MSEPRFRAIEPKILYFGTPRGANQFAERRRRNEPGADIVILDAGVDDYAGIARRNKDGRQPATASGVCGEFTLAGDVGASGKARSTDGKEPGAGVEDQAVPL